MQWLRFRLSTPESAAEFNGTLLSLSPTLRPIKISEEYRTRILCRFQSVMGIDQRSSQMIFAVAILACQVSSVPDIVEYPNLKAQSVAIEAIVKLPKMNPAQRYVLSQAMNLAVQMTPEYANKDILRILQTGTRFRLYQAGDHLRVGLTVDPDELGSGLNLLHSVLTEPSFLADTIKARKSNVVLPWSPAYRGFDFQENALDRDTLVALLARSHASEKAFLSP